MVAREQRHVSRASSRHCDTIICTKLPRFSHASSASATSAFLMMPAEIEYFNSLTSDSSFWQVRLLARGQRHISTQLDVLSGAVRDNLREQQRKDSGTQYWRKGHLFTEGLWEPATGVAIVSGSLAVLGALVWVYKVRGRGTT